MYQGLKQKWVRWLRLLVGQRKHQGTEVAAKRVHAASLRVMLGDGPNSQQRPISLRKFEGTISAQLHVGLVCQSLQRALQERRVTHDDGCSAWLMQACNELQAVRPLLRRGSNDLLDCSEVSLLLQPIGLNPFVLAHPSRVAKFMLTMIFPPRQEKGIGGPVLLVLLNNPCQVLRREGRALLDKV